MKKWEKEILQKQINDEQSTIYRLQDSYKFALEGVKEKIQVLQAKEQTQSVIYQLKYQKALQKELEDIYTKMSQNWYQTIDEYLKDCYEDSFYSTMYGLHQQGIPVVIPFDQKEAVQIAAQSDYQGIKLSEKLYSNAVETARISRQEITKGIAMNSSYADIARAVEKRSEASINQAYRITRTESHRIQNEVKYKTIDKVKSEKGADIVKQWDSTIDKRTRPSHAALDGQLREIDQPFKSPLNGHTAMYPGGFGIASEDINCRCVVLQRARWALDESEVEKVVGDVDGMTDAQLDELAKKLGVSKDELIKKSNGIIENDGSINHRIEAKNYNQFKKKYQKKAETKKVQLQSQLDVAQQEYNSIMSKYKSKDDLLLNGDVNDLAKAGTLQKQISDLQNQLGITPAAPKPAATPTPAKKAVSNHDALMKNAKRFDNGWDADKYHTKKNFVQDRWDNDLTANERDGIVTYTGSSYWDMNNALRTDSYSSLNRISRIKKAIDNATSGLEKTLLAEDTVVFRGMGGADALSKWTGIPIDKLKDVSTQQSLIGTRLTEKAFMSTGTNAGSAWSGIQLEVYLPKGSQAMYVDPISLHRGEYEILVQRNSTFEVQRIDTEPNGYIKKLVLVLVEQSH